MFGIFSPELLRQYTLQKLLKYLKLAYNKLMPSRNVIKNDIPNTYYHVYARGHDKMDIYRDDEDYRVFLNILKRYLGRLVQKDNSGRLYCNYKGEIELVCYCLMPNHFHLLVYQLNQGTMSKLMHDIATSYSHYFNCKYHLTGSIFESRYKASIISSEDYYLHISRYIHRNPVNWIDYRYSSLRYYLNQKSPFWLKPQRVLDAFSSSNEYLRFLGDYKDTKKSNDTPSLN